jgi:hypothetical protein
LLLQNGDKALTSPQITVILNKIFNKKISTSMLCNIFLSRKYGNKSKEIAKDAHEMATSVNVAQSNYIKKD